MCYIRLRLKEQTLNISSVPSTQIALRGFQVTGMIEWGKNKNPKESKGFQKSLVKDEEEQKQEDQDLGQLWLTNQCQ